MDSQDKPKVFQLISSFSFAAEGIMTALRTERNMRFHFVSSIIVLIASFYFSISAMEWIFILFAIGGMFALELVNTAIERVVDLVTSDYQPLAKEAKDMAAGAVMVYAAISAIIGTVIFLPYILKQF